METMDLGRRYRVILVPSSSFQLLSSRLPPRRPCSGSTITSSRAGRWSCPGSTSPRTIRTGPSSNEAKEVALPDGSVIRVASSGWFDPATGLEHTDERYERLIEGAVVEQERIVRSPATRQYDREAIRGLHDAAGFRDLTWLSGFTRSVALPDDRVVTTLARR